MTIINHPMDTEDPLSNMIPFGPRHLYALPAAEWLDLPQVLRDQLALEQEEDLDSGSEPDYNQGPDELPPVRMIPLVYSTPPPSGDMPPASPMGPHIDTSI